MKLEAEDRQLMRCCSCGYIGAPTEDYSHRSDDVIRLCRLCAYTLPISDQSPEAKVIRALAYMFNVLIQEAIGKEPDYSDNE